MGLKILSRAEQKFIYTLGYTMKKRFTPRLKMFTPIFEEVLNEVIATVCLASLRVSMLFGPTERSFDRARSMSLEDFLVNCNVQTRCACSS